MIATSPAPTVTLPIDPVADPFARPAPTLAKVIELLPDELGWGRLYNEVTGKYCALGWMAKFAGLEGSGSRLDGLLMKTYGLTRWDLSDIVNANDGERDADQRRTAVQAQLRSILRRQQSEGA